MRRLRARPQGAEQSIKLVQTTCITSKICECFECSVEDNIINHYLMNCVWCGSKEEDDSSIATTQVFPLIAWGCFPLNAIVGYIALTNAYWQKRGNETA